jgi:hypothetical protein
LGLSDLTALAAPRGEGCRRAWLDLIRCEADACLSPCALDAIASYRPGELPQYLERALADPETLSDTVFRAMALIGGDESWCPLVFDLLVREKDTEGLASVVPVCAPYLLQHDFRPWEVLEHLLTAAEPPCGLLIGEALERAPDLLLPALRRALRCRDPLHHEYAAAVLALVDEPWSREELTAALEESGDWHGTWECRAALRLSRDPVARDVAARWEVAHPRHGEGDGFGPPTEWEEGLREQAFRETMEQLRETVRAACSPADR